MNEKVTKIVRYVLGVLLVFFGLNGFFQFMPAPQMSEGAMALMGALLASGYFMVVVSLVFLATGLMLLLNRFVGLALVVLAPVTLQILLFHIFLDLASILFGLIVAVLHIYLGVANMDKFKGLWA